MAIAYTTSPTPATLYPAAGRTVKSSSHAQPQCPQARQTTQWGEAQMGKVQRKELKDNQTSTPSSRTRQPQTLLQLMPVGCRTTPTATRITLSPLTTQFQATHKASPTLHPAASHCSGDQLRRRSDRDAEEHPTPLEATPTPLDRTTTAPEWNATTKMTAPRPSSKQRRREHRQRATTSAAHTRDPQRTTSSAVKPFQRPPIGHNPQTPLVLPVTTTEWRWVKQAMPTETR